MPALPQFLSIGTIYPLLERSLRIALIVVCAWLAGRLTGKVLRAIHLRLFDSGRPGASRGELEKRAATLGEIVRTTAAVSIYGVAFMMILREIGLDIRPLLVSAGVVGLAIGFGAQNLVRDVISGVFMLLEDQVRIHDAAVINGTAGLVEEINLRTTVMRGLDGTVHIFRNGAINTLSNMTREYSYYLFNIRVAYSEDADRVMKVLEEIGEELRQDESYASAILAPLEVLGIDQFTDTGVIIQARFKTVPLEQWKVGREMNRRIKRRFDELEIQMRP